MTDTEKLALARYMRLIQIADVIKTDQPKLDELQKELLQLLSPSDGERTAFAEACGAKDLVQDPTKVYGPAL